MAGMFLLGKVFGGNVVGGNVVCLECFWFLNGSVVDDLFGGI